MLEKMIWHLFAIAALCLAPSLTVFYKVKTHKNVTLAMKFGLAVRDLTYCKYIFSVIFFFFLPQEM